MRPTCCGMMPWLLGFGRDASEWASFTLSGTVKAVGLHRTVILASRNLSHPNSIQTLANDKLCASPFFLGHPLEVLLERTLQQRFLAIVNDLSSSTSWCKHSMSMEPQELKALNLPSSRVIYTEFTGPLVLFPMCALHTKITNGPATFVAFTGLDSGVA